MRKKIKNVNSFSFHDFTNIEKIEINENLSNIKDHFLNENFDESFYFEKIQNLILSNLSISTICKNTNSFKDVVNNVIKSMNINYFGVDKKKKNFILSEIYIPIKIIETHKKNKNLKWIYTNQIFNYNKNSSIPSHGTDVVFLLDCKYLIISEIKSSQSNSVKNNIKNALIEFDKINDQGFSKLKDNIMTRIEDNETINIIDNIDKKSCKYLIGLFNINYFFISDELDVYDEFKNNSLSIYELRLKK